MLDFYAPKRDFAPLYGNEALKARLGAALENRSLCHAYIVEGPPGSGRHTLALALARAMAPETAEKIDGGNCPDIITVSVPEGRKSIGVDTVRAIKEAAPLTPNELDFKLFIIGDADAMTAQAQNAFLKLLEEPPAGVYFLLLCGSSAGMLPTVKSRAPVLRMQLFSEEELDAYLTANEKKAAELKKRDPEAYRLVLRSAGGLIGEAKKLLSKRRDKTDNSVLGYISAAAGSDSADFYLRSVTAAPGREEFSAFLNSLCEALRDLIYIKCADPDALRSPELRYYFDGAVAETDASRFSFDELAAMYRTAAKTNESLDLNVNIKIAAAAFAAAMRTAAGKTSGI